MCKCDNKREHSKENLKGYPSAFLKNILYDDRIQCREIRSLVYRILLERYWRDESGIDNYE